MASRFAEANAICERAKAEKLHNWITHSLLYSVAVAEADNTAMQREIKWFKGNPMESWVVMNQADNAMALGHLRRSRELFDHARMLALKQGLKEFADEITEDQAGSEADLGNARKEHGRTSSLDEAYLDVTENKTGLPLNLTASAGIIQRYNSLPSRRDSNVRHPPSLCRRAAEDRRCRRNAVSLA